jgi:transposase
MKKFKLFLGIDISKKFFDVSISLDGNKASMLHSKFSNCPKGFEKMIKWIKANTDIKTSHWLLGMEHTGVYILRLCQYLEAQKISYIIESPLRLSKSLGIKRAKNDKIDSKDIAYYIHLKRKELKTSQLPDESIMELKALYAQRKQLVKYKNGLMTSAKERSSFVDQQYAQTLLQDALDIVQSINVKIDKIEQRMKQVIEENQSLKKQFCLVTSVKGIGLINGLLFIIQTQGFTTFSDPRKYAAHAGTAPFGEQSGSSINKAPKVSHLANKDIKAMLTQAANCAVQHDKELRRYYLRKIGQGKNKFSVLNAIKNKLIHRVFAVVKRGTPYVELATFT